MLHPLGHTLQVRRIATSLVAIVAALTAAPVLARPTDSVPRIQPIPWPSESPSLGQPVFREAAQGTVYFGGTFWNADSARWQAIQDSVWTFDSGVGSNFNHDDPAVNPHKDRSLHAMMEGWIGFDNSYSEITYFRRLDSGTTPCVGSAAGLEGSWSFYCGVLESEATALCYVEGAGYGNSWAVCIGQTFDYDGFTPVTLSFDYVNDTEPGYDFTTVRVDTTGDGDDVTLAEYCGDTGLQTETLNLTASPGPLPPTAGPVTIKFCFTSDGAWSDADGLHPTDCGAFALDSIVMTGGITHSADFETDDDGWALLPPGPGPGGDWSNLVHLDDLPERASPCECNLQDSVLVFEDLVAGGHGNFQDNLAASPWIDLRAAELVEAPGKILELSLYADIPLLNYVFLQFNVQWYPELCRATGKLIRSDWYSEGAFFPGSFIVTCTSNPESAYRIHFGHVISEGAEQIRVAVGVISYCRFFANCNGVTNSSPWYDNIRFGVFGAPEAPLIAAGSFDVPQDAFPTDGTLHASASGRIDANNVNGASTPQPGTSLGDTLTVTGGVGGAEVHVQFAIDSGPGIDVNALQAFLNSVTFEETRRGRDWYRARMDTAEFGSYGALNGDWMTARIEGSPGFLPDAKGNDGLLDPGDLDPHGRPTRLANDIFPDDLLTPGSRLSLFYKTRYLDGTVWFTEPDTTGGHYLEMEVLPSSMDSEGTFNCVLYVDHSQARGERGAIEQGLAAVLPGGSSNAENTAWDRWDVRAATSGQGSFGRPVATEYGATVFQTLGYRTILWNAGRLNAYALSEEDANVLIPWLTLGDFSGNRLYLSGDGLLSYSFAESKVIHLIRDLLGVDRVCNSFNQEDCPPGSAADITACAALDPATGARVATRPQGGAPAGYGNGCVTFSSFDVLVPRPRRGVDARGDEVYRAEKSAEFASVSTEGYRMGIGGGTGPALQYRAVVDGLSLHHRRPGNSCLQQPAAYPAIEERLLEVLTWFGSLEDGACLDRGTTIGVAEPPVKAAPPLHLAGLSPNPMHGVPGRIRFSLPREQTVQLAVFDLQGRRIRILHDGPAPAGWNEVVWDGADATGRRLSGGVYFYRLQTPEHTLTRKAVLLSPR